MKGMILAAGLGTRLRPLTDNLPKALIEVEGVPMLERVIRKLKSQGVDEIVVNIHHFGQMIIDFLTSRDLGVKTIISDERDFLLDTGGGLIKAKDKLFSDKCDYALIHNVDIISNANLEELRGVHLSSGNDVTLLVSERESSRKLFFDEKINLKGWHNIKSGELRPDGFQPGFSHKEYAFSGIYIINRRAAEEMEKLMGSGKFSVMDYFLHKDRTLQIGGCIQRDLLLLDIGKPATLSQASELLRDI